MNLITPNLEITHGQHFSLAQAGEWRNIRQHIYNHPQFGAVAGKLFLKDLINMTALEISLGAIPAGRGTPLSHSHRENEEVYIFVKGSGQFLVDKQILEIREGSIIRVAPDGVRAWRNTSAEDLRYIVIQARTGTLANGTITDAEQLSAPTWPESP